MDINTMKNMIILKNLPSNMVEEAFVILKSNINVHNIEKLKETAKVNTKLSKNSDSNSYVVKEAEMIITEYISHLEKKDYDVATNNKKLIQKYRNMKHIALFLSIFCIISILFIIF